MSAWVVSRAHIDALVATIIYGPSDAKFWGGLWNSDQKRFYDASDADELGRELWLTCFESVQHRYPSKQPSELPGHGHDLAEAETYRFPLATVKIPAVWAIKQCHCLRYQSCEHPGWEDSRSKRLLCNLADSCTDALPGYDEAPWGLDDPVEAATA